MMHREEKACKAASTTTRIEALNTDEPLIREDAQPCKVLRADVANTHQSNIREQVQPSKVLPVDSDHEVYAESRLLEAVTALQKSALILGAPHIRRWFDEGLLARAQGDMLQIQVQMLAKLQRLNTRALEDLHARQGHGEGRVAVSDVENELVDVPAAQYGGLIDALAAAGVEREGVRNVEEPLGVVGDCVDCNGCGPDVA